MEKALNNIAYFGDVETSFYGSMKNPEYAAKHAGLRHCQFCGGSNLRLSNTHGPFYSIECACGIELSPSHIDEDGESYIDIENVAIEKEQNVNDIDSVKRAHKKAIEHIVAKWNGLEGAK